MKFAFLSLLFKRFPLEYSFQMAAKYGFDGLEIWGARPHAYPYDAGDFVSDVRGWKKKYGIQVPMYTPELLAYPYNLSSASAKEREDTVSYLKQAIRACSQMECPEMLVSCDHPGYARDYDEAWGFLVSGLEELSACAGEHGVLLRMEPLGPNTSPIVTRADDLRRLIRDVGSPYLKAMMDMAIPPLCAEPFSEYFTKLGKDFDYIHLCGCDAVYETHLQLSQGGDLIDFEDFFRILSSFHYQSWCSVEILDPYYRDPELYLAGAMRLIRSLVR